MSRKRVAAPVALALVALLAAGVAVAAHRRAQVTQQAAATFAATSVTHTSSQTCTASDGTYTETTATYEGTATSDDARLAGPLVIRAHSVVDTTTGLGWVDGTYRVRGGDGNGNASGNLHAAIAGGDAVGTVAGETDGPQGRLVATFSSGFTASGGFSSGTLGSGSLAGAGGVFERGTCTKTARVHAVSVAALRFGKSPGAHADGTFTLDVTRDSSGAIASANAVFYVNYRFGGPVTITGLALHQADGSVALDSGAGTVVDADGSGNLTEVVDGVSPALAQAVLANPRGYDVELTTADTTLRAQIAGFARR